MDQVHTIEKWVQPELFPTKDVVGKSPCDEWIDKHLIKVTKRGSVFRCQLSGDQTVVCEGSSKYEALIRLALIRKIPLWFK